MPPVRARGHDETVAIAYGHVNLTSVMRGQGVC